MFWRSDADFGQKTGAGPSSFFFASCSQPLAAVAPPTRQNMILKKVVCKFYSENKPLILANNFSHFPSALSFLPAARPWAP
jgi:hypothetical protein